MSNLDLNKMLQEEYSKRIKTYGENRILGTFLIGIANYGYAESEEEVKFVTIYLPNFEELCLGDLSHNKVFDNQSIMYDFRKGYNAAADYGQILEILFSRHYIITPRYKELFMNNLYNNRELIAHINEKNRYAKCYHYAKAAFERGDLFEGVRLSIASKLYAEGKFVDECYHIKDSIYQNYLWSCKRKENVVDVNKILEEMECYIEETPEGINTNTDVLLKNAVLEIIGAALHESISLDNFITCLTSTELKAWKNLKSNMIDRTTTISISKIIEETNISRPVWKNLLLKLEQNRIATVDNQGVKGTKITLLI